MYGVYWEMDVQLHVFQSSVEETRRGVMGDCPESKEMDFNPAKRIRYLTHANSSSFTYKWRKCEI